MSEQKLPAREETIFTGVIPGVRDGKIYNNAESKDVEKYVIFAVELEYRTDGSSPCYAYKDQACTEKMSCEELRNAFINGAMVIIHTLNLGTVYCTPDAYLERNFLIDGEIERTAGSVSLPYSIGELFDGFQVLVSAESEYMGR